jgi:hypothetical protein
MTRVIDLPIQLDRDIEPLHVESEFEIRRIVREYARHEIYDTEQTNNVAKVRIRFHGLRHHPTLRRLFCGHIRCWSCGFIYARCNC